MKKFLLCLLFLARYAHATTVTATVTDSDGNTWNVSKYTAQLVSPRGGPTVSGVPVPASQMLATGTLSSAGVLTVTLLDTSTVDQAGAYWAITICPNAALGPSQTTNCLTVNTTAVTGTSVSLTTVLSAAAIGPRFATGPMAFGYADVEVSPSPALGGQYYNVDTPCLRQFSYAGFTCGGGGGGGAAFPSTPGVVYNTSTTASQNATSPQIVTALNASPSTTLSPALVPTANLITSSPSQHSYGDSITCGYSLANATCPIYTAATIPPATAYPEVIQSRTGINTSNFAVSGYQACDLWPFELYPAGRGNLETYEAAFSPTFSSAIGTNDVNVKGTGPYEVTFDTCNGAFLSYLSTPSENRMLAGNSNIAVTSGCVNTPNATYFGGLYCATAGTATYSNFTTYGNSIYVWYVINDASTTQNFTFTVDGGAAQGPYTTQPTTHIATQAGTTISVAWVRVPSIAAGTHTLVFTTSTGGVVINGIGTNPTNPQFGHPVLLVNDIFNMNLTECTTCASVPEQLEYTSDIESTVATLQSDGIDARQVHSRNYMLGTIPEMYTDGLHLTVLGETHAAQAFMDVAQYAPASGTPTFQSLNMYYNAGTPGVASPINWGTFITYAANQTTFPTLFHVGNVNSQFAQTMVNNSTGTGAYDEMAVQNSAHIGGMTMTSTGWTPTANFAADQFSVVNVNGAGGMAIGTQNATPLKFEYNGGFVGAFQGGLSVGSLSDPGTGNIFAAGNLEFPSGTTSANGIAWGASLNTYQNSPYFLLTTGSTNAQLQHIIANTSTGTGAYAEWATYNGSDYGAFTVTGTGWTPTGIFAARQVTIANTTGPGGLALATESAAPIKFDYNSAEVARFQTGLSIGSTTDPGAGSLSVSGSVTAPSMTVGGTLSLKGSTSGTATIAAFVTGGGINLDAGAMLLDAAGDGTFNGTLQSNGAFSAPQITLNGKCTSTASPAVCGSSSSGTVQIAAAATTMQINTTAIAANSVVTFSWNTTQSGCTTAPTNIASMLIPYVTTITAATSFVVTLPVAPVANTACLQYAIF